MRREVNEMYQFKQLDLSKNGIREISDLLNLVFPNTNLNSFEYIDWEYNQNPDGKAVGFNAYFDEVLAAHYVTQPIKSRINGIENRGLLSLNTATHPDHRGKRLFTQLADLTYDYAQQKGFKFVIGVANANSIKGFIKYLGFQLIKPLDIKIGFGLNQEQQNNDYDYIRLWDRDTLKWRLSNPKLNYKMIKKNKQVYILAPTKKFGIHVIIGRFNADHYHEIKNDSNFSFNKIKIWMGVDNKINWKRSFYMNFPDKFKPSPLNLIFKDLSSNNINLDPESMKFQCIDFDAY